MNDAARQLELDKGSIRAVLSGKRKHTCGHEFELAEAREPACLEGERWVEIDVEKFAPEPGRRLGLKHKQFSWFRRLGPLPLRLGRGPLRLARGLGGVLCQHGQKYMIGGGASLHQADGLLITVLQDVHQKLPLVQLGRSDVILSSARSWPAMVGRLAF